MSLSQTLFINNFPGGYSLVETPDPIPNSAVKHKDANGTAGATPWESQSPPGLRGCGAVGSAFEWHSKGRRFDPGQLHP